LIRRFFIMTLICALGVWVSVSWLFPMSLSGELAGESAFVKLFTMILDIVPSDIISPFQTGNALQIIFLAGCVGIGGILLGDTVAESASIINQINAIVQLLMTGISKLLPTYIFLCISNMIITSELSEMVKVLVPLVIITIISLLVLIVYGCYAAVKTSVSPWRLFKAQLPTLLICATTASSAAAFSTNVECCEKKLNIDEKLIRFGIPFGQVLFMPGAAVAFTILPLKGIVVEQDFTPLVNSSAEIVTLLFL